MCFFLHLHGGRTGCLLKSHLMGVPLAASTSYYSATVNSSWPDLPIRFTHNQVWETPPYPKTYSVYIHEGATHSFYTILAQIKQFCRSCVFSTCPERSMSSKSCCFLEMGTGIRLWVSLSIVDQGKLWGWGKIWQDDYKKSCSLSRSRLRKIIWKLFSWKQQEC